MVARCTLAGVRPVPRSLSPALDDGDQMRQKPYDGLGVEVDPLGVDARLVGGGVAELLLDEAGVAPAAEEAHGLEPFKFSVVPGLSVEPFGGGKSELKSDMIVGRCRTGAGSLLGAEARRGVAVNKPPDHAKDRNDVRIRLAVQAE